MWDREEGSLSPCCLKVTDPEELQSMEEDGAFDCDSCEYRQRRDGLFQFDRIMMDLYRDLGSRVVRDLGISQLVFDIHRGHLRFTPQEVRDIVPTLAAIHDFANPVKRDDDKDDAPDKGH